LDHISNGCCASFQRPIEGVVRDIKNALGYIDNPLVHTDTYKKHLKVLDQILSNLVKYIIIFYGFLKNESM
jgi:hypothetical protein